MSRVLAIAISAIGLVAAATASAQQQPSPSLSAPAVIQRACVGCHDITTAAGHGRPAQEWSDTIDRMLDHGLDANEAEVAAVKAYLTKALPSGVEGVPKELQRARQAAQ
jgi:hypothetical protein